MKLFQFFVLENFLVVGLSKWKRICEPFFEGRFRELCFENDLGTVSEPHLDPLIHPFSTKRQLSTEIAPPIARKVSGIQMTEVAYHHWRDSLRSPFKEASKRLPNFHYKSYINGGGRQDTRCQCSGNKTWTNYDSNDGTGDHEELK